MKKLNVYKVYVEDREDIYKILVPATDAKDAESYVEGSGDIIKTVKADPEKDLTDICISALAETLSRGGWGQAEIDVITRTLIRVGLDRN